MRVGVDVGGTKTDAVVIDSLGDVLHRLRVATGFGPASVLDTTAAIVHSLAAGLGVPINRFDSVGVGIPGAVDSARGRVSHAVNLGIDELDLGVELASRLGVAVRVENDVNAAALGAFHLLNLQPESSLAYLNLGTGLAAGLVLGGELWRGRRGSAGEIGHIPIDSDGPLCQCGQRGCLEVVASGSALSRQWPSDAASPVQALFAAADGGERLAINVRAKFLSNVASAVRVLVLTVDVETVVIGGGISSLGDPLRTGVQAVLDEWAATSPFIASLGLAERVRIVPPGANVSAVGAAFAGNINTGNINTGDSNAGESAAGVSAAGERRLYPAEPGTESRTEPQPRRQEPSNG